jgi:hypothetical protein
MPKLKLLAKDAGPLICLTSSIWLPTGGFVGGAITLKFTPPAPCAPEVTHSQVLNTASLNSPLVMVIGNVMGA